jgi:hypothetical protein
MALDLRGRRLGPERALVVDYLATNPVDRIEGEGYKYIGVCLMAVAILRSLELGLDGRLWLESLPDPKTLRFYENLGMSRQPHKSVAGYDVFALETKPAMEFLKSAIDEKWIEVPKLK